MGNQLCSNYSYHPKHPNYSNYSGSLGEGVQNGSDRDVMTIMHIFVVVEHEDQISSVAEDKHHVLVIDQQQPDCNTNPCFTRLRLLRRPVDPKFRFPEERYFTRLTDNGEFYLNRIKLINKATKHYKNHVYAETEEGVPLHGPALLVEEEGDPDMDFVPCLRMPKWPSFGMDALRRIEQTCSVETRKEIESKGCHLVGVPHPMTVDHPELEFRMSFSIGEKLLIRTWSTQQMKVYYLCKEIFNAYFKEEINLNLEKGLCSYFAKTSILWMVEEHPKEYWEETQLLDILDDLFKRLSSYVTNRSCPNYFVPIAYLMATYTELQVEQLVPEIDLVRNEMFLKLWGCKHIRFFYTRWEEVYLKCKKALLKDSSGSEGITDDLAADICRPDGMCSADGIPIKDIIHWSQIKGLVAQFMIFCQTDHWTYKAWFGDDPVKVLLRISTTLHSKFEVKYGALLCSYFHCALMRSIAHNLMDDTYLGLACKKITHRQFSENMKQVESYILEGYRWNGVLSDRNVTGLVMLGLVNHLSGYQAKARELLSNALDQWYTYSEEYKGKVKMLRMTIVFTGKHGLAPTFFVPDPDLRALFEERHMHQIVFDPVALAFYLLVKLGGIGARGSYKDLEKRFPNLKPRYGQSCTEIDSYRFLKYRLGLMDAGEFAEYQASLVSISRDECSECTENKLYDDNLHDPNSAVNY